MGAEKPSRVDVVGKPPQWQIEAKRREISLADARCWAEGFGTNMQAASFRMALCILKAEAGNKDEQNLWNKFLVMKAVRRLTRQGTM